MGVTYCGTDTDTPCMTPSAISQFEDIAREECIRSYSDAHLRTGRANGGTNAFSPRNGDHHVPPEREPATHAGAASTSMNGPDLSGASRAVVNSTTHNNGVQTNGRNIRYDPSGPKREGEVRPYAGSNGTETEGSSHDDERPSMENGGRTEKFVRKRSNESATLEVPNQRGTDEWSQTFTISESGNPSAIRSHDIIAATRTMSDENLNI